jgi:hypothetical protein
VPHGARRERLPPRPDDLRPALASPQRTRPQNPRSNRYLLADDGIRIAKIYNRMVVPLSAADQPQAPTELRAALTTIGRHVDELRHLRPSSSGWLRTDTSVKLLATKDR